MSKKPKYEDWQTKTLDDGQHIDVDISHDGGVTDIMIEAHVRQNDWERFNKYCLRYGHGDGKEAIINQAVSMIYRHSADYNLDDNKTKTYFSPYFKTWTERLTRYLVFSHITIIAISYLHFLILGEIDYYGYLATYTYVISLVIALICWFMIGIRNSLLGDRDSVASSEERSFFVWTAKYYWILWIVSALLLLVASSFRLATFVVTVSPDKY